MTTENAFNSIPYSTTQGNRTQVALLPKSIGLDQRPLPALISEIRLIAKTLPFKNEQGLVVGNWQQFLDEDVLFFLVELQEFLTAEVRMKMSKLSDEEFLPELISLIKLTNDWYKKSLRLKVSELIFELENAIEYELKKSLQEIASTELTSLHPIWRTHKSNTSHQKNLNSWIERFLDAILYWQKLSTSLFEKYAQKQELTKPHSALVLSFLKLYRHIQKQFNGITKKHLNHYFEDLLGQEIKKQIPERTFVFFNLAKEAISKFIPKKTLLLGGMEEDGNEILFETSESLHVSHTSIADLITLFVASNAKVSPHNKAGLITGVFKSNINDVVNLDPNNTPRSLFGFDGFDAEKSEKFTQSDIGWAISGPVFILKEGARKVSIDFHLDKEELTSFKETFLTLEQQSSEAEEVWISRFFGQTFNLEITTDKGWVEIDKLLTTIREETTEYILSFAFSFTPDDPSIISYDQELHSETYESKWPVVKITLDKENVYYPYSFLREAQVNSIHVKVDVKDLERLDVCDPFGTQDTSRPFPLFGLQPGSQASCYIGHDEWRYKTLTSVDLSIDWHQLEHVDFKSIYKQYPGKITYANFAFDVSSLSSRQWKSSSDVLQEIPLFQKDDQQQLLSTSICIQDDSTLRMVPDLTLKETLIFEEAKNGYFRLRLTNPEFGFGHGIYENLVNKTVQEITKNPKKARKENIQIPQLPLVPEALKIHASYTAEQEFVLHSKSNKKTDKRYPFELFHIHPFGLLSRANQEYIKDRSLLPYFEDKGYLYLGLENAKPLEILSLYFRIETSNANISSEEPFSIHWEYLSGEFWKETSSTFLLYDGTDDFQHSGIVRMQMPKQIEHNHPLLDPEKTWLRISAPNHLSLQLGKVVCMQLNAVEAIRKMNEEEVYQSTLNRVNAITTPYVSIPEVQSISQPFIPTSGVEPEEEEKFYTRVSEQLAHKKRAILPSDFEVLILDAFPEVYQVSCFPSSLFPKEVPPGTLQIMVLPYVYEDTPPGERKLNAFKLQQIKSYLQKMSIHQQTFKINNPNYETIHVSCAVGFNQDYDTGMALQNFTAAINRFIAPWMLERGADAFKKEGKEHILHPSSLGSYLLNLPEVENISALSLLQMYKDEEKGNFVFRETKDTDSKSRLKPSKPWSVFVPSTQHNITIVSPEVNHKARSLEIGTMEIENNFILQNPEDHEY